MNRPWMPLYVSDYLADTAHLTASESGAYLHLIMHYWQKGGLPSDDESLGRIARMTPRQWAKARPTIAKFFDKNWRHKRIEIELARAVDISKKRRKAAQSRRKSAPANAPQKQTHARATPPSPSQSQKKERTESGAVASATRPAVDEAFDRFWGKYPKRDGANPKAPARKIFGIKIRAGADPPALIAGVERYEAECRRRKILGTVYVAQAATWLREERWTDDQATAPPDSEPAWKKPPPEYLEHVARQERERLNGASRTEIRGDPGVGQNGADQPEKL